MKVLKSGRTCPCQIQILSSIFLLCLCLRFCYGITNETNKCMASSRSRSGTSCGGNVYIANESISRAGGIPLGSRVCLIHRNDIIARDRRCSYPSSWEHSTLHQHPIPQRLHNTLDTLGVNVEGYQPGTRWCNKCKKYAERELVSVPTKSRKRKVSIYYINIQKLG